MRAANNQSKSWSVICIMHVVTNVRGWRRRRLDAWDYPTYCSCALPMSPTCGIALYCIVLHGIMLLLLCQCHQHVVLHCIVLYCMALCYYCSAYIANMCLCKTIWCSDDEDRTQRIILNQPRQGLREQNHLLFVSTIICYLYHLLFAICINYYLLFLSTIICYL